MARHRELGAQRVDEIPRPRRNEPYAWCRTLPRIGYVVPKRLLDLTLATKGQSLSSFTVSVQNRPLGGRDVLPRSTEDVFRDPISVASMFNKDELAYLKSQLLVRVATATAKGKPNVAPVGFEFDGRYFYIGSIKQKILRSTPRYLNIKGGNRQVALVIDDLVSVEPWKVRGIRVNGVADIVTREGEFGKGEYIRIKPKVSWSWGLGDARVKTVWK